MDRRLVIGGLLIGSGTLCLLAAIVAVLYALRLTTMDNTRLPEWGINFLGAFLVAGVVAVAAGTWIALNAPRS